ncbi:aldehyde dehydrogenase family protein [Kineococcus rubinsiae]|uniref:aldehyde dehydrogenase family protein n=1 Tax=Kineococcus rubinsiae TaxID=2609562 RepID=UPI001FCBECED|nr:aldehyde dehydrogenase family protein [Kineococcus rubinsiae]
MPLPEPESVAPRARRAPRRRLEDARVAELPPRCRATPADGGGTPGGEASGPLLDVPDPTTGSVLTRVVDTGPVEAAAVLGRCAASAREGWAWLSGEDRARHLYALADALEPAARPLAVTTALVAGRPVRDGLDVDGPALLDAAFSAAGWADKLAAVGVRPRPGGVVVVVATWRTPAARLAAAVVTALAVGSGVLLRARPAAAPLALRLARACEEAGLPAGLVGVVPGEDPDADAALWDASDLVAVVADGPAADLRELALDLADRGTPLLAQPDPAGVDVVLAGADLDAACAAVLRAVAGGAWRRPGGSRVLVAETLAAGVLARLTEGAASLRVGHPLNRATDVGPCPSAEAARAAASARTRPAAVPADLPEGGWWALPGVLVAGPRTPAPPPGPLVGVRTLKTEAEVPALLVGAGEVTVWGGRHGPGPHRAPGSAGLDLLRALGG